MLKNCVEFSNYLGHRKSTSFKILNCVIVFLSIYILKKFCFRLGCDCTNYNRIESEPA
jgi:hypothetical protein